MNKMLISLLAVLLISSCSVQDAHDEVQPTESNVGECIPPLITFAYPINQRGHKQSTPIVLPTDPWIIASPLPEIPSLEETISSAHIGLTREHDGETEIWVIRRWSLYASVDDFYQILIYHPRTAAWSEISTQITNSEARVDVLLLGEDGTIWAEGGIGLMGPRNFGKRVLAKYNESAGKFELVQDLGTLNYSYLIFDPNGIFWILKDRDGIYNLDPVSGQQQIRFADANLRVFDIALASDGSLYISSTTGDELSYEAALWHFIPETNEIVRIDVPPPLVQNIYHLFMDNTDRLWLNDLGWLEKDGTWYQTVRSPVFITDRTDSSLQYFWPPTSPFFESSDGRLWFGSYNGTTWLDPQEGKWCWFTTFNISMAEDQLQNIWMVVNGSLYNATVMP